MVSTVASRTTPLKLRTLFISPGNTARSLLAEAALRKLAPASWHVSSCGVPGYVGAMAEPLVLQILERNGFSTETLRPKSWSELKMVGMTRWDFVIALADDLPLEIPMWLGNTTRATWAYPPVCGPAISPELSEVTIQRMLFSLQRRTELLISLSLKGASRQALQDDLRDLRHM